MAAISVAAGAQPFLKTRETPQVGTAGEAIGVFEPIYKKASDGKWYVGDADPADLETNVIGGVSISKAETNSQVVFVSQTGTIIDMGTTLTDGADYWLTGSGTIGPYADVASADLRTRIGFGDINGDFEIGIVVTGTVKP